MQSLMHGSLPSYQGSVGVPGYLKPELWLMFLSVIACQLLTHAAQDLWSLAQQQRILHAATRLLLAVQQGLALPEAAAPAVQGLRAALLAHVQSGPGTAARSAADFAPAQLLLWALDTALVRLLPCVIIPLIPVQRTCCCCCGGGDRIVCMFAVSVVYHL
jgi:hypothetical protein